MPKPQEQQQEGSRPERGKRRHVSINKNLGTCALKTKNPIAKCSPGMNKEFKPRRKSNPARGHANHVSTRFCQATPPKAAHKVDATSTEERDSGATTHSLTHSPSAGT